MDITTKSRRLRKYEGEERVVVTSDGTPPIDFYSPFGPMIARTRLPAALVERINAYADTVVMPDRGSEFLVPEPVAFDGGAQSLASLTSEAIRRYYRQVENSEVTDVRIDVFWIVSQYAGSPSPVHFHSGDISGVVYLKMPTITDAEAEEQKTYIAGRQAGYINFMIGGKQPLSKSLISFKPEIGDFYVFPGWLLHGAEPFRGSGERRSMAFNAYVTTAGDS